MVDLFIQVVYGELPTTVTFKPLLEKLETHVRSASLSPGYLTHPGFC